MKSKAWYYKFRGDVYAIGPARFDDEIDEAEARRRIAKSWNLPRLPKGRGVWATND